MRIAEQDRIAIGAAVTAAERTTDAEIVAIVAERSDRYHDAALHWVLIGLLLLVAVMAAIPAQFVAVLDGVWGGWGGAWTMGQLLCALLVLLIFAFLLLLAATRPDGARMLLTPASTKTRRVRARAVLLFRAAIEARTATRTGVLLYVSLAERRAEIVTDDAVLARVSPDEWAEAMSALLEGLKEGRAGDGMVAAIDRVGAVLATHFPHTGTDPNELPDRLIEL
jgi:putative membrane protein